MSPFIRTVFSVTFMVLLSPVAFGRWFWVFLLVLAVIGLYWAWLRWDTERIRQIVEKSQRRRP